MTGTAQVPRAAGASAPQLAAPRCARRARLARADPAVGGGVYRVQYSLRLSVSRLGAAMSARHLQGSRCEFHMFTSSREFTVKFTATDFHVDMFTLCLDDTRSERGVKLLLTS